MRRWSRRSREPATRPRRGIVSPDEAGRPGAAGFGLALDHPRPGADHSVGAHGRALARQQPRVLASRARASRSIPADASARLAGPAGLPRKDTNSARGFAAESW